MIEPSRRGLGVGGEGAQGWFNLPVGYDTIDFNRNASVADSHSLRVPIGTQGGLATLDAHRG